MPLPAGTRLGPYEVIGSIGEGGMGQVYRAKDTRLGRHVALKTLPDAVARDTDRLARFEREARTLAALNHPNIAQVYGFEDGALIMEFVEGETLRARLDQGPLPVRKAIDYGSQIARGLAAAHERGIIHRDLKPENVIVLPDGHVKILDFGLARPVSSPLSESESATGLGTDPGTVLGTVGYMAPEQVRGQTLDARADLFALGAVLYEMLAGRRAFHRETAADTLTAILTDDPPPPSSSRPEIGPALDTIVRHALEKGAAERFQTARDVAFALDALSGSASSPSMASVPATRAHSFAVRERLIWAACTASLAAVAVWLLVASNSAPAAPPAVPYRSTLLLPDGLNVYRAGTNLPLAFSPDGRWIAYVAFKQGRPSMLWRQSLTTGEAIPIEGTEDGNMPFWSPDGREIGFRSRGGIHRVAVTGGRVTTISSERGAGTWAPPDVVLASVGNAIQQLTATGGVATTIWRPASPEERYGFPSFLPDGRHYLFSYTAGESSAASGYYVGTLGSSEKILVHAEPQPTGAQFANGHVLFPRDDSLFAVPFDVNRLRATGPAVRVVGDLVEEQNLGAFGVSPTGALVYAPIRRTDVSRLVWMNRDGQTLSMLGDEADYSNVELSPDGTRLLVSVLDQAVGTRDIHVMDVARGVRQRFTFDPSDERSAVWSHDGRQVIYNSKNLDLYSRPADFTGAETPLIVDGASKDARQVSPDGRFVMYRRSAIATGNDIWIVARDGNRKDEPLIASTFNENYGVFSPDGRSVAFVSNDAGRADVYVLSREGGGGKMQVSTNGGSFPRWRRDGREIVYLDLENVLVSVPVSGTGASFRAGNAVKLFAINPQPGPGVPFDMTADGTRFLVNAAPPTRRPWSFVLLANWTAALAPSTSQP